MRTWFCGFRVESDLLHGYRRRRVLLESPHLHNAVKTLPSKWTRFGPFSVDLISTVCIIEMIQRILFKKRKERIWIFSVWNKPEEKRARFGLLSVHYNWLVAFCCRSRIIWSNCSLVISPLAYRSRMM